MIEVLNLGAGVQSSTILLMSLRGELPRIDYAVFADTGWEPPAVYRQFERLQALASEAGVRVDKVAIGNIRDDAVRGRKHGGRIQQGMSEDGRNRWGSLPYFVRNPDGSQGMVRRQCTRVYKIRPIDRWVRSEVLGLAKGQRAPKEPVVRRWYGISFDEVQRMRDSVYKWEVNWYPLVDMRITRTACFKWLHDAGFGELPRSACIGCPYRSDREWREMRDSRPEEWADAVEFDKTMRHTDGIGEFYLHRSCEPLGTVNLWTDQAENQLSLFGDDCSGMCGV